MSATDSRQTIMIVDDNPTNLGVIVDYLEHHDFRIVVARDGETAVKRAEIVRPDVILLDVMMPPGIDGFETCRRLKANEITKDIPVIFMTALARVEDKVLGFEVGAVDYVTKPIQQEEVLARVNTHLTLRAQQRQLEAMTGELQETNKRLAELNASKDKFFTIIAHDLQTPFNSLIGNAQLLLLGVEDQSPEEIVRVAGDIYESASTTYILLQNLLDWARLQQGQMPYQPEAVSLNEMGADVMALFKQPAGQKKITLVNNLTTERMVLVDKNMINLVIRNLVSNSIKFTPEGGKISISTSPEKCPDGTPPFLRVWVSDTGVGMTPETVEQAFRLDQHYTTPGTNQEIGSGLGLLLCQEMVTRHGGKIEIESKWGKGTTVGFTVPTP